MDSQKTALLLLQISDEGKAMMAQNLSLRFANGYSAQAERLRDGFVKSGRQVAIQIPPISRQVRRLLRPYCSATLTIPAKRVDLAPMVDSARLMSQAMGALSDDIDRNFKPLPKAAFEKWRPALEGLSSIYIPHPIGIRRTRRRRGRPHGSLTVGSFDQPFVEECVMMICQNKMSSVWGATKWIIEKYGWSARIDANEFMLYGASENAIRHRLLAKILARLGN